MKIQQLLEVNCPNIVTIIGKKVKFWSKVELRYLQRLNFIEELVQEKNYRSLRITLIDNLILFKSEREKLTAFLHDIDVIVKAINDNFYGCKTKIDKLRYILEQLILPEIESPKSYDRIAEIYAINYLLSQKRIRIIELEYRLSNGKHIDCLIQNIENGENFLLDFISINVDGSKVETSEKFGKWLTDKVIKKYSEKTINLKLLDYQFKVFPILWIENKILKENLELFEDSETNFNTEFYFLRGIENITENKYHTMFGSIKEMKYWIDG